LASSREIGGGVTADHTDKVRSFFLLSLALEARPCRK